MTKPEIAFISVVLTGAVGADQPDDLAGADVDAHAADRGESAEANLELVGAQREHGRVRLPAAISRGEGRDVGSGAAARWFPTGAAAHVVEELVTAGLDH